MAKQFKFNTDKLLLKNNKAVAIEDNVANLDLSNLSEAGRKSFFPSNTFVSLDKSTTSYIAPANGYFFACADMTSNDHYIVVRVCSSTNSGVYFDQSWGSSKSGTISCIVTTKKDQLIKLITNCPSINTIHFVYAEGEI